MINRHEFEKLYPLWTWSLLCWIVPGISALGLSIVATALALTERAALAKPATVCVAIFLLCLLGLSFQLLARIIFSYNIIIFKDFGGQQYPKPVVFRIDTSMVPGSTAYKRLAAHLTVMAQDNLINDVEKAISRRVLKDAGFQSFQRLRRDVWQPFTVLNYHSKGFQETWLDGFVRRLGGIPKDHWVNIGSDTPQECVAYTKHELGHFILRQNFDWDLHRQHQVIFNALGV